MVTRNGFAKSGNARIGSDIRASLRSMKASLAARDQENGLFFFKVAVIGEAILAYYDWISTRYQLVRPKNPRTSHIHSWVTANSSQLQPW